MRSATLRLPLTLSPQRLFVLGLLGYFVVVSIVYSVKASEGRSAILRWQQQVLSLNDGEIIYTQFQYPNPPIMAVLLWPLAQMGPMAFALSWFYLKVAMTLLTLVWVFRLVESADTPFPPAARAIAVLLSLWPITDDLTHGNINLFIVFLVVACLYAFRNRLEILAGILLALAIACKVTPALFVAYFAWKRAWKTLLGCALGLALFVYLVPGGLLGWDHNLRLFASWFDQMVRPFLVGGVVTSEHNNQSLPGLLMRLLTDSPSFSIYVDNKYYTPTEWHNFVKLDVPLVGWLVKGCLGLFALLVAWSCRTSTTTRAGWRLSAEFSIIVLGMLLFSERTWKHHCVTFVLPFSVLVYYLATCRPTPGLRRYLIGTLIAVVLLMASTSISLQHSRFAKLAQVYGAYVWVYLILLAALVVLLQRPADGQRALRS